MAPADIAFTFTHAETWACPSVDSQRAQDYAAWYVEAFARSARDMSGLPAHPDVWADFLDSRDGA